MLMYELGGYRGIGDNPAYVDERLESDAADRIAFIKDFYSEAYADLRADVVVCRHTLEHIHPVRDFMVKVRRSLGDRRDVTVLFELPDVLRVLKEVAFWDIYYEHCSYFSPGSLARLFRSTGFDVLDLSLDYDDQYILIEARPGDGTGATLPLEEDLADLSNAVRDFEATYPRRMKEWHDMVAALRGGGRRAVIWGAGSKGVSFLTTLGLGEEIDAAVDINPFKQGMYMAGTGHRIVSPEHLKAAEPDVVVVMNPVYREEIRRDLEAMGLSPQLVSAS